MDPLTADSAKLFDAEWGAFMARGDELFQIAVYNSGQLVKATPKGLSARFTDADYPADAALRWTYADVLPLESLVEHKAVAMPGAILDHIRDEEPELYTHLLREFHLEFTAVESNTVVRLQLRVP
ncbi:MAG: hypothetical protein IPQ07_37665 [Myxococcales bacterium]|nr:hypothetical protein [Myxococcales bacterium]